MTTISNGDENGSSSSLGQETVIEERTVIKDTTGIGSGGSSDSSSSVLETTEPISMVKEEDEGFIDDVNFNNSPLVGSPKAVEGLYELGPTPFLRKTFQLVDDAVTDPVVSWNPTRKSFIIWDSYKFSKNLLPKYFKHKNFSSFVRQLNTYGFKKVDSDRWEFANEGFQGGNKHLLKNIKRRSKINSNKEANTETEVESLKKDQSSMKLEILKLNQQQKESHNQVVTVQEKIHRIESKQQHMLNFFAKFEKDQRYVERLMRKRRAKQQRELEAAEFVKNLKLLQDQENLLDVESDMVVGEDMTMAATPELDIVDGLIGGNKTVGKDHVTNAFDSV